MRRFFEISINYLLILTLLMSVVSAVELNYDDNGNLIDDEIYEYEYNSKNQLVAIYDAGDLVVEYFYAPDGNRYKKIDYTTDETNYYVDSNYVVTDGDDGLDVTKYYYEGGLLVGKEDSDGDLFFYHSDHLGSTNIVTDESGDLVEETTYLPFGAVIDGGDSRYLFTGQEFDSEVDLSFYESRYYSPELRQFVQPDSLIPDVYNPQTLNAYSYTLNNPVKYVDPSGNIAWVPVLLVAWGIAEVAMSAYDAFDTARVLSDPDSSRAEKVTSGGLFVAGLYGPGAGYSKADDVAKAGVKAAQKIPIDKLFGHETDDALRLFREGAKTHVEQPIQVIKVGDNFLIDDGVGRSMREMKNGGDFVYGNVRAEYGSYAELSEMAKHDSVARADKRWFDRSSKINDPKRWEELGVKLND